MPDCLFCKIVERKIPARIVHEDEEILAFEDIDPQAPVHVLVVPKTHLASLDDPGEGDTALLGKLLLAAGKVARARGIADTGWRVVANNGRDAHQLVLHLHVHVLGGRKLGWPPG